MVIQWAVVYVYQNYTLCLEDILSIKLVGIAGSLGFWYQHVNLVAMQPFPYKAICSAVYLDGNLVACMCVFPSQSSFLAASRRISVPEVVCRQGEVLQTDAKWI